MPQTVSHPMKAVPIAVAEEEGSESEEDELKPRGKDIASQTDTTTILKPVQNMHLMLEHI